jgi:hypothetical protein
VTFEVRRIGGVLGIAAGADSRPIRDVCLVVFADLLALGFSQRFVEMCREGFPSAPGRTWAPRSAIGACSPATSQLRRGAWLGQAASTVGPVGIPAAVADAGPGSTMTRPSVFDSLTDSDRVLIYQPAGQRCGSDSPRHGWGERIDDVAAKSRHTHHRSS